MKIRDVRWYRFTLPLKEPLLIGANRITQREGWLLQLSDENGFSAFGEASPLPGLHNETLMQCVDEFRIIKQRLVELPNFKAEEITRILKSLRNRLSLSPSVWFALDGALISLSERPEQDVTNRRAKVNVNALLSGNVETWATQATEAVAEGFRSLKIKVGRQDLSEELSALKALLRTLPANVSLRLDANRFRTLKEAIHLAALPAERIEYIEEPLQNPADIPQFFRQTGIAVALDETLREAQAKQLLTQPAVNAMVLKPSILGGWLPTVQWAQTAKTHNKTIVISDTFSSGVGLQVLADWIVRLGATQTAHGLDTYRFLADDVLGTPLEFSNGALQIRPIRPQDVDWSKVSAP